MGLGAVQPTNDEIERQELIEDTGSKPALTAQPERRFVLQQPEPWSANLLFTAITACLSPFTVGYNIVTLEIQEIFTARHVTFRSLPYVTRSEMGFVIGSFALGALASSLVSGPWADLAGRKQMLLLNAAVFLIGVLLFAFCNGFLQMLVGRFIIGLGAGISCVVVPMYLSEICPNSIRGLLGIFHQCSIVIGMLTSQIVSYWLGNEKYWMLYFLGSVFPPFSMLLMLPFCPDSPIFHLWREDRERGEKALRFLRPSSWKVSDEVKEIHEAIRVSKLNENHVSLWNLVRMPIARRSLLFCLTMHCVQQFSGIDLVLLFPKSWFGNSRVISVCIGVNILVTTLVASWLVERVGRRKLTLISTLGCCVGMTGLSFFSFFGFHAFWRFLMLILYISSFSIGLGPITWIIINDIFPPDTRASAMTLAVAVNSLSKFFVMIMYKPMYDKLHSLACLPFCLVLLLFFCYAYFQMRETKGRPDSYL